MVMMDRSSFVITAMQIHGETVEKPKINDFDVYKWLILLGVKIIKLPFSTFFDSLGEHLAHCYTIST